MQASPPTLLAQIFTIQASRKQKFCCQSPSNHIPFHPTHHFETHCQNLTFAKHPFFPLVCTSDCPQTGWSINIGILSFGCRLLSLLFLFVLASPKPSFRSPSYCPQIPPTTLSIHLFLCCAYFVSWLCGNQPRTELYDTTLSPPLVC